MSNYNKILVHDHNKKLKRLNVYIVYLNPDLGIFIII